MKKIEIYAKSERTYNLSDMGYGISQLMPLILNPIQTEWAWFFSSYLVIVWTEANLHPSLQSKIADLVAYQYNKYGSTFIIETHSEYLIRKLQYLCKDVRSPLSPEDVMIHYFIIPMISLWWASRKQITINEEGNLTGEFGRAFTMNQVELLWTYGIWTLVKKLSYDLLLDTTFLRPINEGLPWASAWCHSKGIAFAKEILRKYHRADTQFEKVYTIDSPSNEV